MATGGHGTAVVSDGDGGIQYVNVRFKISNIHIQECELAHAARIRVATFKTGVGSRRANEYPHVEPQHERDHERATYEEPDRADENPEQQGHDATYQHETEGPGRVRER